MIVDLLRNDLSRVCVTGLGARCRSSVGLETYAIVHHLVSVGRGGVSRRARAPSICCAPPFPAAPSPARRRCARWRSSPNWSRRARSLLRQHRLYRFRRHDGHQHRHPHRLLSRRVPRPQVGGGIVTASDPAAEYEETLDKARAMFEAFGAKEFARDSRHRQL